MVDIIETIQNKYVPIVDESTSTGNQVRRPAEAIFMGGDQLTEERARNIQLARADGVNKLERQT